MSEKSVSVAEVASDFLRILAEVESERQPATLVRDGHAVARLIPLPAVALTCAELAQRWDAIPKLAPAEAQAFADDLEAARSTLPALKAAWD